MAKKSTYKVIAEAMAFNGLKNFKVSTKQAECRKLTIDEIKECIKEEFEAAKEASDVKVQEPEKGWTDPELENEIEWAKALNIKEFFKKDFQK